MARRVIVELAEKIKERFDLYSGCLQADLTRLRKIHGAEPVREALGMIDELQHIASYSSWYAPALPSNEPPSACSLSVSATAATSARFAGSDDFMVQVPSSA
jgi:hypothetical protein